jgi:DNA invertase Pin-like site-specific DNA recombinase
MGAGVGSNSLCTRLTGFQSFTVAHPQLVDAKERLLAAVRESDQVRKLHRGGLSKAAIARRLEIGRTSVRRILGERIRP